MSEPGLSPLATSEYVNGILAGDRSVLGRAITLVESTLEHHQRQSQELLRELLAQPGCARRIGISGSPGVGKSTFIDSLGSWLVDQGHTVAVLAVDPSSSLTGGSILGDKTRMPRLAASTGAFIRPSPSGLQHGGVAANTREAMVVVEAAGYDTVIVETVGVGQTETAVAEMVDCYLSLLLAGGGDELQGIKRGYLELVDLLVVTKADGDNIERARRAQAEYQQALDLLRNPSACGWRPQVLSCSGRDGSGIPEVWDAVEQHWQQLHQHNRLAERRSQQLLSWMWSLLDAKMRHRLATDPRLQELRPRLEQAVLSREVPPQLAAEELLAAVLRPPG